MDRYFFARVPFVLRFYPVQGSRQVGTPVDRAGAFAHCVKRGRRIFCERKIRNRLHFLALPIEYRHFHGETRHRHEVGKRFFDEADPHVVAVGRDVHVVNHALGGEGAAAAALCVEHEELCRGKVGKKHLVMRAFQQILVGAGGGCLPGVFGHDRTCGYFRLCRCKPAVGRDSLDEQVAAIRKPAETSAQRFVQGRAVQAPGDTGTDIGQPELNSLGCGMGKRNFFPVGRPARCTDLRFFGQALEGDSRPAGKVHIAQRHACEAACAAGPVCGRVDA